LPHARHPALQGRRAQSQRRRQRGHPEQT
jgi:hypothetical protein